MGYNQLSGTLPLYWGHLLNLNELILRSNKLTGEIPKSFDSLRQLQYLYLDNNRLTGNIPEELSLFSKLSILHLENNQLSGNVPIELTNLTALVILNLSNNQLSGTIPGSFGKMQSLETLYLSYNQFTGSIPKEICESTKLSDLYLDHNQLSGSLPNKFVNSFFGSIYLNQNNLTGPIPKSLGSLHDLQFLSLAHNNFTGIIPNTLKNCGNLLKLQLADNQLRGSLPSFLKNLPTLDTINIENNHFTFAGLEPLVQHNFGGFYYDGQKKITIHQSGNTLYVNAGGTLSNNTYKWFKGSTLVATIHGDSTYAPTSSGIYHVEVTNSICTDLVLQSGNYSFNTLKSAQSNISLMQTNKTSISVYPNPAQDFINVNLNKNNTVTTLNVYDIQGKILITQKIILQKQNADYIDITSLAAGTYFIEAISNDGTTTQKFVKE